MNIHLHYSDDAYRVEGSMIQSLTTGQNPKAAMTEAVAALRKSPGDYAFILDWMRPVAVIRKIDDDVQLFALEHQYQSVGSLAFTFVDGLHCWENSNAWAEKALSEPGVVMAIITSSTGIDAAFEKGPGGKIELVACGDKAAKKKPAIA